MHAPHGYATKVVAIVERGDEQLQAFALGLSGCGDDIYYLVEQIGDVLRGLLPIGPHPPLLSRTIDHGEVELLLGCPEVKHKVEHHLIDLFGPTARLINLVDNDDGFQPYLQCLLQDEARLGHRAFEGIDEQEATIGHVQHALHLTAKVGVARGVDDVDFRVAIAYRNIL